MRLTRFEKDALFKAVKGLDNVYLFGSRVDDSKKGGDIDILIFSDQPSFQLTRRVSCDFFSYCEEKLDVLVIDPDNISNEQQAFINTIEMVKLQ